MKRRALWLGSGLLGLAAWRLARALEPGRGVLPCPVRHLLGMPCPGCGMTRALLFLAHGDWRSALVGHPLAPLFVAQVIAGWLFWGLVEWGKLAPPSRREVNGWLIGNAALLLAVWAWRFFHGTLPS